MLGFVNKLFISVQLIFFLDHVLLLAQKFKFFKIAVWWSDSMKRNFRRFVFTEKPPGAFPKLHWPFNSGINWIAFCLELQKFSRSLEQFLLTVGQNNFGNKIPFFGAFLVNVFFWKCSSSRNTLNKFSGRFREFYRILFIDQSTSQHHHGKCDCGATLIT